MASYDETGGYCSHCDRRVMVKRPATSHVLHLLLTIFTAGLWVLVWLGQSIKAGGWRCSQCGSRATNRVPWRVRRRRAAA